MGKAWEDETLEDTVLEDDQERDDDDDDGLVLGRLRPRKRLNSDNDGENRMRLIRIEEPELEFGTGQRAEYPRDGLFLFGPVKGNVAIREMNYGVIGTRTGRRTIPKVGKDDVQCHRDPRTNGTNASIISSAHPVSRF